VAEFAGLPWGSLAAVYRDDGDEEPYPFLLVTGPARYKDGGWYLPIFGEIDLDAPEDEVRREVEALGRENLFAARQVRGVCFSAHGPAGAFPRRGVLREAI
jgi:hypothetical protein